MSGEILYRGRKLKNLPKGKLIECIEVLHENAERSRINFERRLTLAKNKSSNNFFKWLNI